MKTHELQLPMVHVAPSRPVSMAACSSPSTAKQPWLSRPGGWRWDTPWVEDLVMEDAKHDVFSQLITRATTSTTRYVMRFFTVNLLLLGFLKLANEYIHFGSIVLVCKPWNIYCRKPGEEALHKRFRVHFFPASSGESGRLRWCFFLSRHKQVVFLVVVDGLMIVKLMFF